MMSVPLDMCLFHRFYDKWFRRLSPVVTAVPWQTYPGHVPCEVPDHRTLSYQFDRGFQSTLERHRRRSVLALWKEILWAGPFPEDILSRPMLLAAYAAHRLKLRNYNYLARFAASIARWRRLCTSLRFSMVDEPQEPSAPVKIARP
jgi:hypothetical protein